MRIKNADWPAFLEEKVMDWNKVVHIEFADELVEHVVTVKPEFRIYLQEREQMFVMQPAFVYNDIEIKWSFPGAAAVDGHGTESLSCMFWIRLLRK